MLKSPSRIVRFATSDGVELAIRIYGSDDVEPRPVLFAASPYRFDNDDIPKTNTYLWRETGPIDWYVDQGYAYAHMDVRGTGRSDGEYQFMGHRERRDLYDAIEWIAVQPWCSGKVGGIGHSYYATTQWAMASERPPHLSCIAPYDGHVDLYRGWAYHGGLHCSFLTDWWHGNVRRTNLHPVTEGASARDVEIDLPRALSLHPDLDAFWQERAFAEKLDGCDIPVFSIGAWSKRELHLGGNIEGYRRVTGPKRLLVTAAANMSEVQADFESIDFHEKWLLPFYDHYLKGIATEHASLPPVLLAPANGGESLEEADWPPEHSTLRLFLSADGSGDGKSLNDGTLSSAAHERGRPESSLDYPGEDWSLGNVLFTGSGFDSLALNLTFTSEPIEQACVIAGNPQLKLFISSSTNDVRIVAKLFEEETSRDGSGVAAKIIAKGWLRASHRNVIDREYGLLHDHTRREPLVPEQVYEVELNLTPIAYCLSAGARLRLDLSTTDSPMTDSIFTHPLDPNDIGTLTVHHSSDQPSVVVLPIMADDRSVTHADASIE